MVLEIGKLYRLKKDIVLSRYESGEDESPEVHLGIDTTTASPRTRGLRVGWSKELAADFQAFHELAGPFGDFVEKGSIVMYAGTGTTGSYRLLYSDFVGWTKETLELLEEADIAETGEVLQNQG